MAAAGAGDENGTGAAFMTGSALGGMTGSALGGMTGRVLRPTTATERQQRGEKHGPPGSLSRANQTDDRLNGVAHAPAEIYGAAARSSILRRLFLKDARGQWRDKVSSARTKTEAKRLAGELERKCERQRLGLEALPDEDGGGTFDELMRWWLVTYSKGMPSHKRNKSSVEKNLIGSELGPLRLTEVTAGRIEVYLQSRTEQLGPQLLQSGNLKFDLLGSIDFGGGYEDLLPYSEILDVGGSAVRVLTLEKQVELKRQLTRPCNQRAVTDFFRFPLGEVRSLCTSGRKSSSTIARMRAAWGGSRSRSRSCRTKSNGMASTADGTRARSISPRSWARWYTSRT